MDDEDELRGPGMPVGGEVEYIEVAENIALLRNQYRMPKWLQI